jgi:prepilin-type N-terminal cleavage/methylation domain-containing protein/prepilin-type processing-associated H-X9-DG protein
MHSQKPCQHARAFTLIELLVVISIVSVLIAMLLPSLGQARDSARLAQCKNNVRQMSLGWHFYSNDFKNYPPVVAYTGNTYYWMAQIAPYLNVDPNSISVTNATIPTWAPRAIKLMQCPTTFGKATVWEEGSYGPNSFLTQYRDNDQYKSSAYSWWLDRALDGPVRLDDRRITRQNELIIAGESVARDWLLPSWNAVRLYDNLHLKQRVFSFLDGHVASSEPQVLYVTGYANAGYAMEGRNNHGGSGEP